MSSSIEDKLKYIGLDLNNIPDFLKQFTPLNFRLSKLKEDNVHIVYKYIPIDKIQILITPKNRLEDLEQKYTKAVPIGAYLEPTTEENIERHSQFLSMLKQVKIEEIEDSIDEQKKLDKKIPFDVKYNKSYTWQIYYSEYTDQYFMMVPSEDQEFDKLFLLLKMQIEFNKGKTKKVPHIFVPINYMDYSEDFLKKSEIKDIENYLWLFTKDWTNIYEVYNKNNEPSLHLIGQTNVYQNIKSKYRIVLETKEESKNFYQFVKALFILQTELAMHYKFTTKISSKSELEFYYNNTKLKFENLSKFIENEYKNLQIEHEKSEKEIAKQKIRLENLQKLSKEKENEYIEKQKQIALYLECRKTFFGKVKYFFKHKKIASKSIDNEEIKKEIEETENDSSTNSKEGINSKLYYTIEDLVTLYYVSDKLQKELNNIKLDIEALKIKIYNIEQKVKNATLYIEEIDKHKKSIFEFWKFANKDELQALEVGTSTENNENNQIRKTFKYEFDFENLSVDVDKTERIKLSKIEQDSAYIATTELIDVINNIDLAENALNELKTQQEENVKVYSLQEFEIFGNIQDNRDKTKNLGNNKHRENKKDKFKTLEINKKTTVDEFKEKINDVRKNLNESFNKIKSKYDMSLYIVSKTDDVLKNEFSKYYMNLEHALKSENCTEKEVNVYKINLQEGMNLIYCTNIIFYDNFNKTLPLGMNEEQTVLLKNTMYDFEKVNVEDFKTNMYFNKTKENVEVKKVIINEFNLKMKEKKD